MRLVFDFQRFLQTLSGAHPCHPFFCPLYYNNNMWYYITGQRRMDGISKHILLRFVEKYI